MITINLWYIEYAKQVKQTIPNKTINMISKTLTVILRARRQISCFGLTWCKLSFNPSKVNKFPINCKGCINNKMTAHSRNEIKIPLWNSSWNARFPFDKLIKMIEIVKSIWKNNYENFEEHAKNELTANKSLELALDEIK